MRVRRLVWALSIVAALPAAAFVFVPTRAGVDERLALGPAAIRLAADTAGRLYQFAPGQITALRSGDGRPDWSLTLPDGFVPERILEPEAAPVFLARHRDAPTEVFLVAMDDRRPDRDVWHRTLSDVPPGAVRELPGAKIAVRRVDALELLSSGTGQPLATHAAGKLVARPALSATLCAAIVDGERGDELELLTLADGRAVRLPLPEPMRAVRFLTPDRLLVRGPLSVRVVDTAWPMILPIAAAPAAAVATAPGGPIVTADATVVDAFDAGGAPRWSWRAPAGRAIRGEPLVSADQVVVALKGQGDAVTLVCLSAAGQGTPTELWRQTAEYIQPNGLYIPPEGQVLAVQSKAALLLVSLPDGRLLARRPVLGQPAFWIEDTAFCAVPAGRDGRASVIGIDLSRPEELAEPKPIWSWLAPAGEQARSYEWLEAARILIVRTDQRAYLFE